MSGSGRMKATSSLRRNRSCASPGEYWLDTVTSILASSPLNTRIACGSQSISWPVRKPRAKRGLDGAAASLAAAPAASTCANAKRAWSKGLAGRRQLDAAAAAQQQLGAHLILQSLQLPAQRRLRREQPALGGGADAALLGDGDKITQMA